MMHARGLLCPDTEGEFSPTASSGFSLFFLNAATILNEVGAATEAQLSAEKRLERVKIFNFFSRQKTGG